MRQDEHELTSSALDAALIFIRTLRVPQNKDEAAMQLWRAASTMRKIEQAMQARGAPVTVTLPRLETMSMPSSEQLHAQLAAFEFKKPKPARLGWVGAVTVGGKSSEPAEPAGDKVLGYVPGAVTNGYRTPTERSNEQGATSGSPPARRSSDGATFNSLVTLGGGGGGTASITDTSTPGSNGAAGCSTLAATSARSR